MNFKDEIVKTIRSYGNKVAIFSNGEKFKSYCLFRQLAKNEEEYFNAPAPDSIGEIVCSKFVVWIAKVKNLKTIDFIICNNIKYEKIYEKYRDETGCFEVVVVERNEK